MDIKDRIDKIFWRWDHPDTPGGQVAVRYKGELIYSRCFGLANIEHSIPVCEDTCFHVASVSKQVTILSMMLLVEEGKICLDDDVRKYLPDLVNFSEPVTIRQMMNNISGISPIVARELSYRASGTSGMRVRQLGTGDRDRLLSLIFDLKEKIKTGSSAPVIVRQKDNQKLVDFCFDDITQYGDFCDIIPQDSPSAAVEQFFIASAKKARFEQKTKDLFNAITRLSSRITRTCAVREKELKGSENAEKYRVYGELINANLYCMQNGMTKLVCQNYYDNCNEISIPLRADRSPAQNAQLYFKKYTKAKNSAQILTELIRKDKEELRYLDSVFMALCDCETIADANGIREELIKGGYLKRTRKAQMGEKPTAPRQFEKDGYTILVGKNNMQNDFITVKMSRKNDIWLHTKNVHSSHVLIKANGTAVPDSVIEYAASLCAFYSRAKDDLKVEVDYCPVQNVKKPVGAKPGMAVYDGYNTVIVNPWREKQW